MERARDRRTLELERAARFLLELDAFARPAAAFRRARAVPEGGFNLRQAAAYEGLAKTVHRFWGAFDRVLAGEPRPGELALYERVARNAAAGLRSPDGLEAVREALGDAEWVAHLDLSAPSWVRAAGAHHDLRELEAVLGRVAALRGLPRTDRRDLALDLAYQPAVLLERLRLGYRELDHWAARGGANPERAGLLHTFTSLLPDATLELEGNDAVAVRLRVQLGTPPSEVERLYREVRGAAAPLRERFPELPRRARKATLDKPAVLEMVAGLGRVHSGRPRREVVREVNERLQETGEALDPSELDVRMRQLEAENGYRLDPA